VLVVDKSTIIRRLLTDSLAGNPEIDIAGTAPTLEIALAKIPQVNPDVIILDPEILESDGLVKFYELRRRHPQLLLIMFGALTPRAGTALRHLCLEANDFVAKPKQLRDLAVAAQCVRAELVPKINALCGIVGLPSVVRATRNFAPALPRTVQPKIIAIGVSTGGPNALAELFRQLPIDFPLPIVVVQHMPPMFTKNLADRLNSTSQLDVREATDAELIGAGRVLLAPGDFHMVVAPSTSGMTVQLHQGPRENSCRPAADVLFRSIAEHYGPAAIAVVLTGMGQDGLLGCQAIRDAGGLVIAQDETTSVVWGMPGAVATKGLAEQVLPLHEIASELNHAARANRTALTLATSIQPSAP
jgi:two-component system chemotaxis response regulator CheB